MSEVNLNELENIVLEGGGAKGVAYLGAIRALEKGLKDIHTAPEQKTGQAKAILDFGSTMGVDFVPQVKRFAGSSAGAITSFALALGLNADEIKEVTAFPFAKFLHDHHVGKYRMVGEDGKIMVGEDHNKLLGLGDGSKEYALNLHEQTKVRESFFKKQLRAQVLGTVKEALFAGILQVFAKLGRIWQGLQGLFGANTPAQQSVIPNWGLYSFMIKHAFNVLSGLAPTPLPLMSNSPTQVLPGSPPPANSAAFNEIANKVLDEALDLLFWNLQRTQKMNIDMEAIGCIIWDRGMFSGFAVREFFHDLMIFAAVKDTHFSRSRFPNEDDQAALRKVKMKFEDGRIQADFTPLHAGLQEALRTLPDMTFEEFYDYTGISLTLCVSNFTSDEPLFFSEQTSPRFPVAEAVGASMSIPPAIKPVYTACNVWPTTGMPSDMYVLDPVTLGKKRGKKTGYFDHQQYELDQVAVKLAVAKEMNVKISTNSPMSFTGYLLLMLNVLRKHKHNTAWKIPVTLNGEDVEVSYWQVAYHYNAAFKGLLLDGGYRINIPYNIYRNSIFSEDVTAEVIDPMFGKTLAIKLDNMFPPEWVSGIYKLFSSQTEILNARRYFRKRKKAFFGTILKKAPWVLEKEVKGWWSYLTLRKADLERLNETSYEHIAHAALDIWDRMHHRERTPWNKQKSILALAAEGYGFGTESGQIRFISDHEHIIPLFSWGIGTYDFDLTKLRPLEQLAQDKAEEAVKKYFHLQ